MQVKELMNPHVWSVRADDSLDAVTRLMWNEDIGALPVVDEWNHPIGMVTDRDIAMSAVINGTALSQLRVSQCMSRQAFTCVETDTVEAAAGLMRAHQVRRLPVVDDSQRIVGMLTLNDLAHAACGRVDAKLQRLIADEVVRTLDAVTEPREGRETEAVVEASSAPRPGPVVPPQAAKPAAPAPAPAPAPAKPSSPPSAGPAKGGAAPRTSPPPKGTPAKTARRKPSR